MKVPVATHACQHLMLSVLWILVIPLGEDFIVALICILLIMHDVEHIFL